MDNTATPSRSASFESIPEVSFMQEMIKHEIDGIDLQLSLEISPFKRKELNGEFQPEPLLLEDKSRFVLFPIKHQDVRQSHL